MAFLARIRAHSYNTEIAYKQGIRSRREPIFCTRGPRLRPEENLYWTSKCLLMASSTRGVFDDASGGLRASDLYSACAGSTAFGRTSLRPRGGCAFTFFRREAAGDFGRIR